MASHSRSLNPIHFFKIILKPNLQTLRIPNKFTVKYGDCLPNPLFLKPPDGKEWEVQWTKDHDNGFWFQNGWNEFSSFYSLDFGHLVVFKYEGTSQLDVNIFDQSALEIDYPFHDSSSVQNHNLNNKISDENVVEILDDDMPPNQKVRPKTTVPSPQPHKKMRTSQDVENKSSNQQNLHVFQKSTNAELENCRHESLTALEKMEALKRSSTFRSENPFFKVVMQPSYVSGKCSLFVPVKFAKKYLNVKSNAGTGSVQLLVEDGVWSVGCLSRRSGKNLSVQFSCGWRQFYYDNDLKVGDVCVFELIQRIRLKLQVTIFRATKHPVHSNDVNVVEILDDEMPSNQKVRPKTIVPSPRPHKKMKTSTRQDVENKSSNLQNLDAFQNSTNSENCKHESEEDMEGEAFAKNKGLNFESMKSITHGEKMEALKRASTFRSENPFFTVVMQPSYVIGSLVAGACLQEKVSCELETFVSLN